MPSYIHIEVEDNDNCYSVPLRAFSAKGEPREITRVHTVGPKSGERWWRVTGWSSNENGTPCPAYVAPVEAPGAALSYLVYGGDWGLRLAPADSDDAWALSAPSQWGEPCFLLAAETEVIFKPL